MDAAAAVSSTTTPTVPRVSFRPSSKPKQQFKRSHSTASTGSCCSKSLGVGHFPQSTPTTSSSTTTTKMPEVPLEDGHAKQHPALQTVCVMDCMRKARIIPNSDEAFPLSNECFDGSVMLLMRSPDVDEPGTAPPSNMGPNQLAVSEYFKGKKRRFEFQFQIKLKKVPTGPLFLGCELEHSIKVGALTKGLVGVLLAMVRRINPGFHYSWGPGEGPKIDKASIERGDYEKTHLSFPVEASMDRIVISKPGDPIPKLGEELHESLESVKRRRRMGAGSVEWNTEDTFTMCLWSAYCDWIQWKSSNVPGVSPFLLSRVTGAQPIYLCVYEISSCAAADYKKKRPPHNQNDLLVYSRMEFSNVDKTTGGYAETILGRRKMPLSSEHSVPDTDSVGSEIDTLSRVSHITN